MYCLVVIHMNSLDGAVDARSNRIQMAIDLGIVRIFKACGIEIPANAGGNQHNQDYANDDRVDAPRLLRRRSGHFGSLRRLYLGFSAH